VRRGNGKPWGLTPRQFTGGIKPHNRSHWTRGSLGCRVDRGHSLHDRDVRRSLWTLERRAVGVEPFVRLVPDRRGPESRRFQHTRDSLSFRDPLVPLLKERTLLETSLNGITTGTTLVSPAQGAGEVDRRSRRGPIEAGLIFSILLGNSYSLVKRSHFITSILCHYQKTVNAGLRK